MLSAESKYPVDISYMVADLKYSQEHGVKICEMQHGILSTFFADVFMNGDNGLICPQISRLFAEFDMPKWTVALDINFPHLLTELKQSHHWKDKKLFTLILKDSEFQKTAQHVPLDPYSVVSYTGMVYVKPKSIQNHEIFSKKYPGIIVIDAATHPYWVDKYKMSCLFNNPLLSKIKPEWGVYPKTYSKQLADQIIQDIKGDAFVIKPRGAFLGNGVIIVSKEDLDTTLHYILDKPQSLKMDPDNSYNYWNRDRSDTFIVEKYYPSDILQVDTFAGKSFEPTMRIAFMMIYNNKTIDIRFLGGYWMLPHKSLDEPGSLNDLKKAYCKLPYFTKATDADLNEVRQQIEPALRLLYQAMLEGN